MENTLNNNPVSRQAVKDIIYSGVSIDTDADKEYVCELIDKLPSVTPKEKTGHWIKVTNGRGGHECDLCHEYAPSYRSGDEYLTKYCPNCKAKMIESQESEDKE